MPTQKQIDANRRNAARSTGPKTPEGKQRVRQNALKHGLTAEVLLPSESEEDFKALREALESEYDPVGPTEQLLVEDLVAARLRIARARIIEAGFFSKELEELDGFLSDGKWDAKARLALVITRDANGADAHARIGRYETRLERSFHRALKELQRLQALRKAAETEEDPPPDGFVSQEEFSPPPAAPENPKIIPISGPAATPEDTAPPRS